MKRTIYMKSTGLPERTSQALNVFLTDYFQNREPNMLPLACTISTKNFTKIILQSYSLKTTTGISLSKNDLLKNKSFASARAGNLPLRVSQRNN